MLREVKLIDKKKTGLLPEHKKIDLESEERYPQEFPDYWETVNFTPCPVCQAPIVWYEAEYVPGYRVCTKAPHHHSLAQ